MKQEKKKKERIKVQTKRQTPKNTICTRKEEKSNNLGPKPITNSMKQSKSCKEMGKKLGNTLKPKPITRNTKQVV
jgi:hypothetical protein